MRDDYLDPDDRALLRHMQQVMEDILSAHSKGVLTPQLQVVTRRLLSMEKVLSDMKCPQDQQIISLVNRALPQADVTKYFIQKYESDTCPYCHNKGKFKLQSSKIGKINNEVEDQPHIRAYKCRYCEGHFAGVMVYVHR